MSNDIIYLDNFISDNIHQHLMSIINDYENFAWYYQESIVNGIKDSGGFSHLVIVDDKANSPSYNDFMIIFDVLKNRTGIDVTSVIRFRIRMTLADDGFARNNHPHTDHTFPHTVLLIYMNESDGDTVIYDKVLGDDISEMNEVTRFSPKAKDAIIFDGLRYHSGAVPSKGRRIVCNIDFI